MYKNSASLEILTENGNPVTEYNKDGLNLIEGRTGVRGPSNFKIRIKNHSSLERLFIVSVDGISVNDGKKANFNSNGYVLRPYETYDIDGWRISNEEVRKFFFSKKNQSYSNKIGEGQENCGVIGLVVFDKKVVSPVYINWEYTPPPYRPYTPYWHSPYTIKYGSSLTGSGEAFGGNQTMAASASSPIKSTMRNISHNNAQLMFSANFTETSLGTGMGEVKTSNVTSVSFDRCDSPAATFEIFYYTRRELEKMGVIITNNKKQVNTRPNPFPGQYCKEV